MSQHDMNVANASAAAVRADINSALVALATMHAGATAPSLSFPNQPWYDTANNRWWLRDNANTAWLPWFALDANGKWTFDLDANNQDVLRVLNAAGTQVALLRLDSSGNGKIVLYNSSGDGQVALLGNSGQLWLEGDENDGKRVGPTNSSAEQAATADTVTDVAHGLGQRPRSVWGVWRCLTAEFGYVAGDEIRIEGDLGGDNGSQIAADATNVTLITSATPIRLIRKDTNNSAAGTVANWRAVLRWAV